MTAVVLFLHERKQQPDRDQLTAVIVERSWNSLQVVVLLATLFLLYLAAGFTGQFFYEEQIPFVRLIITLVIYGILMAEIGIVNAFHGSNWSESLGMGFSNLRKLLLAPVVYLAAIPLIIFSSKLYHLLLTLLFSTEPQLQSVAEIVSRDISWLEILYICTAIFAAPVYEEMMFRGVIFPYLLKRTNLVVATTLVALLFAVIHFHTPSFVSLALLSAVLSLSYWRTGSLWVSIGVHMIFNAVTILALNI